jgi:hypothetical protein
LAIELDKQHREINQTLRDAEWTKTKEMLVLQAQQTAAVAQQSNHRFTMLITNAITVGAFALVLVVFAYMILFTEYKGYAMLIFGGVAASACVFFYKNFTAANVTFPELPKGSTPIAEG